MHEKLLQLCFFAERCVILEVNKIRQPPGCSKGVNEIMKEYAFGIDLGGTTAKIGLFTTAGALLEKWEVPTDTSNAVFFGCNQPIKVGFRRSGNG